MILKHGLMKPITEAQKGQFNELQKEVLPVEVQLPEVFHLKIENLLVLKISQNSIRETLKNGLHKIEWLFLVYYVNNPIERIQLIAPLLLVSVISQIQTPITENTYEEVKKVLRSTYAPSARERVADLFQHKLKPGEKPSEYLNRIRLSLGDSPFESMIQNNETVAKEMFLQVLPDDTAAMLEVLTVDLSIYKMVEVADKYMSRRSRIAANHYRNESVNA